jgi:DNA repair ATPase RecN
MDKATGVAARLTDERGRAAGELKNKIEGELLDLGMKGCVFETDGD